MKSYLKYLIKKHFYHLMLHDKVSPAVQIAQNALALALVKSLFRYDEIDFNVFTYAGEDGLLFNIICRLEGIPNRFIDIGSGDCIKSNCANLSVNHGWKGLFIDANKNNISIGKAFYRKLTLTKFNPPEFLNSVITTSNVNALLRSFTTPAQTGLLSIDIDGDDYWVWEAITITSPWVVIIEAAVEFGKKDFVTPYSGAPTKNSQFTIHNSQLSGASVYALVRLGKSKGYSLVSANRMGYNLIFLRNDLLEKAGITELNPEIIFTR
jgi:hypothetical protein